MPINIKKIFNILKTKLLIVCKNYFKNRFDSKEDPLLSFLSSSK